MTPYETHVRTCAEQGRTGKSDTVYNRSPAHASIILQVLFEEAARHVDILTGFLNDEVYGEDGIIQAVRAFAAKGGKLRILMENPAAHASQANRLIDSLKAAELMASVDARAVPVALQSAYPYHFSVVDSQSYRMEGDKADTQAIGTFGDKEFGQDLQNRFNEIWAESTPISL